jgi:hypothetical protein
MVKRLLREKNAISTLGRKTFRGTSKGKFYTSIISISLQEILNNHDNKTLQGVLL